MEKKRIIERKLQESNMKGQKPTVNAIAQGFQPSRESLSTKVKDLFFFYYCSYKTFIYKSRIIMMKVNHSQHYIQILQQKHQMVIYHNFRKY